MTPQVSIQCVSHVVVVAFSGRLTLGAGSQLVRETLSQLRQEGHRQILVDLGGVTHLDSSGLGALVAAFAASDAEGGQLKLVNAERRVRDLLIATKLHTVFEVFVDQADAIHSFPPGSALASPSGLRLVYSASVA